METHGRLPNAEERTARGGPRAFSPLSTLCPRLSQGIAKCSESRTGHRTPDANRPGGAGAARGLTGGCAGTCRAPRAPERLMNVRGCFSRIPAHCFPPRARPAAEAEDAPRAASARSRSGRRGDPRPALRAPAAPTRSPARPRPQRARPSLEGKRPARQRGARGGSAPPGAEPLRKDSRGRAHPAAGTRRPAHGLRSANTPRPPGHTAPRARLFPGRPLVTRRLAVPITAPVRKVTLAPGNCSRGWPPPESGNPPTAGPLGPQAQPRGDARGGPSPGRSRTHESSLARQATLQTRRLSPRGVTSDLHFLCTITLISKNSYTL